ncbi:MAG: CBS domain-containing protein [Deltaproteobacteria bacterium]|nr:CBS domain-containing protein [Deltaproteobacteria bacterium]
MEIPNVNHTRKGLFSVGGVDVAIDGSWLVIFALVVGGLALGYFPTVDPGRAAASYWLISVVVALLFFVSILLHELAHAWVSNRFGVEVKRITLFIFGGAAQLSAEPADPRTELEIAIAGPLTSLGLGLVFGAAAWGLGEAGSLEAASAGARYLAYANVAVALFNSLPGLPLDGGRIARSIFWRRSRDFRGATIRAAEWGKVVAGGLMGFGALDALLGNLIGGLWFVLIGSFLRTAAEASRREALVDRSLQGLTVADLMVSAPQVVEAEESVAGAVERQFLHHGFGGFPVMDDGRPIGILSLREVRACPRHERPQRRVREIMRATEASVIVSPADAIATALRRMSEADCSRLLVIENGRLLGLITRSRIASVLHARRLLEGDGA